MTWGGGNWSVNTGSCPIFLYDVSPLGGARMKYGLKAMKRLNMESAWLCTLQMLVIGSMVVFTASSSQT